MPVISKFYGILIRMYFDDLPRRTFMQFMAEKKYKSEFCQSRFWGAMLPGA